jgi:phage gpG-like protein
MAIRVEVQMPAPGIVQTLFQRILSGLGLQQPRPALLADLRDEYLQAIQQGFDREKDPYGVPWQITVRKMVCKGPILTDTRRLRRSISAQLTGSTVRFSSAVPYARTHQYGATVRGKGGGYLKFKVCGKWITKREIKIPARPFLPDGRGLPQSWIEQARRQLGVRIDRLRR